MSAFAFPGHARERETEQTAGDANFTSSRQTWRQHVRVRRAVGARGRRTGRGARCSNRGHRTLTNLDARHRRRGKRLVGHIGRRWPGAASWLQSCGRELPAGSRANSNDSIGRVSKTRCWPAVDTCDLPTHAGKPAPAARGSSVPRPMDPHRHDKNALTHMIESSRRQRTSSRANQQWD